MNFYKPGGKEGGWLNKIQAIPILQDEEQMRTDREFRRGKVHTTLNKPVAIRLHRTMGLEEYVY